MFAFAITIFTSAFLIFQVQPVIARFILPWYGGTPAVWTTCMLFFQVGLLGGYTYAHLLARYVPVSRQPYVHLVLILLSLLTLPITPSLLEGGSQQTQILEILAILLVSVGLPFILLSASAPLLQYWFSKIYPNRSPFKLYALSNTGSLLALLSYPFIVEPSIGLYDQTLFWSVAYSLFFVFCFWCVWPLLKNPLVGQKGGDFPLSDSPSWSRRMLWMSLAACGSVLLLAITNQISLDVAVIPFLWVLPLSLYLVSFIISFERDRWYRRAIWFPFTLIGFVALVYLMLESGSSRIIPLYGEVAIYCLAMFGGCMICHGEIVRKRPASEYLTVFYLYIALGGALGGVFVNLIAPLIFDGYWELPLVVLAIVTIIAFYVFTRPQSIHGKIRYGFAVTATVFFFGSSLWAHVDDKLDSSIFNTRGFYGVLHLYEGTTKNGDDFRSLFHGRILHGDQYLSGDLRYEPTSYYGKDSGVGIAIHNHPSKGFDNKSLTVGVIGLGAGTIATYGEKSDQFYFYEINPQIVFIANHYFSYLEDSKASNHIILGDGRLSLASDLKNNGSREFDILVVDAFSGDAIPTHLLTAEAFELYWKHIKPGGILAVHITNIYVELSDPVRQLARRANKDAIFIASDSDSYSDWVLITSNKKFIEDKNVIKYQSEWTSPPKSIVWTDDFSNLFDVVRW
jgi:hypothetical protein